MRSCMRLKAAPACRTSVAPSGRISGPSRPRPKSSAASASRRSERTWMRMNKAAITNSSTADPASQPTNRKIVPEDSRLRGATTCSTPSGSCRWIETERGSDVQSVLNGAPNRSVSAIARSSSFGPSTLTQSVAGSTAPRSSRMTSRKFRCAVRNSHASLSSPGKRRISSTV